MTLHGNLANLSMHSKTIGSAAGGTAAKLMNQLKIPVLPMNPGLAEREGMAAITME